MTRAFGTLLPALLLLGACAGSPPPADTPPLAERVSVRRVAREHGLALTADPRSNRLLLEDRDDRILLFPGTSVAVVNGYRVRGMGRIGPEGRRATLRREDAARIDRMIRRTAAPRFREMEVDVLPVEVPRPEKVAAPAPRVDPAWQVPLRRRWRFIVVHHSATDSGNAARFHRHHRRDNGWDGLGYHFVIGNGDGSRDGQVEVGYRWTRQLTGAHAGRPPDGSNLMNETGIGICLVGNFEESRPTAAQRAALHRLLDYLRGRCGIPADHVLAHRDIRGTSCPGRHFPYGEFMVDRPAIPPGVR